MNFCTTYLSTNLEMTGGPKLSKSWCLGVFDFSNWSNECSLPLIRYV